MAFSFHITSVYKACNNVVFTLYKGYNSAVPKRHLVAKSEFAYSLFTQNSVVNVNWHINKEKKI